MIDIAKVMDVARAEWARWGFSVRPLHKPSRIGGVEATAPFIQFVNDYWKVVGEPGWNGHTPQPWSAAFISYCFKNGGSGAMFPYRTAHVEYCRAILASPAKFPELSLVDPATTPMQLGDLLWAARAGSTCPAAPVDFKHATAALKAGGWFCSHCDIVVGIRDHEVDVLGGNVSDSVTQTTYVTDGSGKIADPRHSWLALVRHKSAH